LSEHHFQRLFRRWAGISPKRFLQFLTVQDARELLDRGLPTQQVAWSAGLSGGNRLHDLIVSADGVTPGEYRARGAGLRLQHGMGDTPFGRAFLAIGPRGICELHFAAPSERTELVAHTAARWPEATLVHDEPRARRELEGIFADWPRAIGRDALLHLRGSNFQLKVWEALLRLPLGRVTRYADLAASVGRQGAARAVGQAVGANCVALLIPCHRVIRADGRFGDYRWGRPRKQAILGWEATIEELHQAV
jgi:AraC family transcriptional regulator of adaptative response/methylated-DNA-[protein]-cysteine methyltransferase